MSDRIMAEPCNDCGRTGMYYCAHGLCRGCYKRWKRKIDPAYAERDKASARGWKAANRTRTRAYDAAHAHKPCPVCGVPMSRGSQKCEGCQAATADVRRTLAEGMWADGWLTREITATLGMRHGQLAPMRVHGWDLPHRYRVKPRVAA